MPTAKKQPNGQWKCRVYSHLDENGKQHLRAFYGRTKQEAEQRAMNFTMSADRERHVDLTVHDAIDGYITAREGVLSPSTVLGYKRMLDRYYEPIAVRRIRKLNSADVQKFVSDLASKVSPKTVSNVYGLLTASVALYAPEIHWSIKLPTRAKKRPTVANSDQIRALYDAASPNLKKAIALSAFTSMRRGEICALLYGDIDGDIAHVHADLVRGHDGWHRKETPKTSDSDRFVRLPQSVIQLIGTGEPSERVVPITPDSITELFGELRDKLEIPIRFHDLRHYFASIAAVLGIPQTYTERAGGWHTGSPVMREIYQKPIVEFEQAYAGRIASHFSSMLDDMTQNMTQDSDKPHNDGE